jgi:Fic-DOC domain mobile mystery protein B
MTANGYGRHGTSQMSDETEPVGATPGGDTSGLIRQELTTPEARNGAETEAIDKAYAQYIYTARRKKRGSGWLTDEYLRQVHADMFGSIWNWAGKYRKDPLSIGVAPQLVPEHIRNLCGDFEYWDSAQSSISELEIAARLQSRLTYIHPFINGNGRHARLMTDIFFHSRGLALPRWPQIQLMAHGHEIRERYVSAMKKADQGDVGDLMNFMKDQL